MDTNGLHCFCWGDSHFGSIRTCHSLRTKTSWEPRTYNYVDLEGIFLAAMPKHSTQYPCQKVLMKFLSQGILLAFPRDPSMLKKTLWSLKYPLPTLGCLDPYAFGVPSSSSPMACAVSMNAASRSSRSCGEFLGSVKTRLLGCC